MGHTLEPHIKDQKKDYHSFCMTYTKPKTNNEKNVATHREMLYLGVVLRPDKEFIKGIW